MTEGIPHDGPARDATAGEKQWWKSTWPLERRNLVELAGWLVLVIGVASCVGWLLTDALAPNAITDFDDDFVQRLADGRTVQKNNLAEWGSLLSATYIKIIVTTLLAVGMLWAWRRWRDALLVAVSLVFEATAFVVTSYIVARPRPEDRLLDSPVDASFPSGHVAAAAAYAAIVVVVFWHVRSWAVRVISIVLVAGVVVAVAWARMYQGMHHPSDVVAGAILGLVSVAICHHVIGRPDDAVVGDRGGEDHVKRRDGATPGREASAVRHRSTDETVGRDADQEPTPYHDGFPSGPLPDQRRR